MSNTHSLTQDDYNALLLDRIRTLEQHQRAVTTQSGMLHLTTLAMLSDPSEQNKVPIADFLGGVTELHDDDDDDDDDDKDPAASSMGSAAYGALVQALARDISWGGANARMPRTVSEAGSHLSPDDPVISIEAEEMSGLVGGTPIKMEED